MLSSASDRIFYGSLAAIAAVVCALAIWCDGTGGGGDSILHYQYAHYAAKHPENFFDHWAKPFFTILSFPFALAGFTGIKLFNCLCSLGAAWFGYKILSVFNTPGRWAYALLLFSSTLFVKVTLSGLTEPLSALMLLCAIYGVISQRTIAGLTVISFMPFVRSEGLIIIGVFVIYLFAKKNYRALPWLLVGHVVMSVAGSFYYHDLLWVFNRIPYANMASNYGRGTWTHFLLQLFFQLGPVLYGLLIIGGIGMLFKILTKGWKTDSFFAEKLWLIYGGFFCFFAAHTSFWALSIFNSMGLVRVFVSVIPLVAIIALFGLNDLLQLVQKLHAGAAVAMRYVVVLLVVVFPFFKGASAYKIPEDFTLNPSQQLIKQKLVPYLLQKHPAKTWIIADLDVSFFSGKDPFNKQEVKWYSDVKDFNRITQREIVICDSWFAPVEWGINEEKLRSMANLKQDTLFTVTGKEGKQTTFSVFYKR